MEVVIAFILGLILITLLGIHKTLYEFQNTVMHDANEHIQLTKDLLQEYRMSLASKMEES